MFRCYRCCRLPFFALQFTMLDEPPQTDLNRCFLVLQRLVRSVQFLVMVLVSSLFCWIGSFCWVLVAFGLLRSHRGACWITFVYFCLPRFCWFWFLACRFGLAVCGFLRLVSLPIWFGCALPAACYVLQFVPPVRGWFFALHTQFCSRFLFCGFGCPCLLCIWLDAV